MLEWPCTAASAVPRDSEHDHLIDAVFPVSPHAEYLRRLVFVNIRLTYRVSTLRNMFVEPWLSLTPGGDTDIVFCFFPKMIVHKSVVMYLNCYPVLAGVA